MRPRMRIYSNLKYRIQIYTEREERRSIPRGDVQFDKCEININRNLLLASTGSGCHLYARTFDVFDGQTAYRYLADFLLYLGLMLRTVYREYAIQNSWNFEIVVHKYTRYPATS